MSTLVVLITGALTGIGRDAEDTLAFGILPRVSRDGDEDPRT